MGLREFDPTTADAGDFAEKSTAFFAEFAVSEIGVIGATQPTGGEAAREGHFEGIAIGIRDGCITLGDGGIERFAIDAGDSGDVFGRFEAAFDFE